MNAELEIAKQNHYNRIDVSERFDPMKHMVKPVSESTNQAGPVSSLIRHQNEYWARVDDAVIKDAERYRWLREQDADVCFNVTGDAICGGGMGNDLDAYIDAAMSTNSETP